MSRKGMTKPVLSGRITASILIGSVAVILIAAVFLGGKNKPGESVEPSRLTQTTQGSDTSSKVGTVKKDTNLTVQYIYPAVRADFPGTLEINRNNGYTILRAPDKKWSGWIHIDERAAWEIRPGAKGDTCYIRFSKKEPPLTIINGVDTRFSWQQRTFQILSTHLPVVVYGHL